MERNKFKIVLEIVIFAIFFLGAVISLTILTMSNMNYITNVSIVGEPVLLCLSIVSFIVSLVALTKSILLLKEI